MKYYKTIEESTTDVNGAFKPLKSLSEGFEFVDEDFFNAVDPITATIEAGGKVVEAGGKVAESVGDIATARSNRKVAELKVAEIGGKRTAQLKACEENKAFKKFADPKYRRNRINDCQAEVKKRLDIEEKEQRDIIRRSLDIEQGKVVNQRGAQASNQKFVIIGVGIIAIIGLYIIMKKK
jgi:hypothetical protein